MEWPSSGEVSTAASVGEEEEGGGGGGWVELFISRRFWDWIWIFGDFVC